MLLFLAAWPAHAKVEKGREPGILGPPAVENGIIYFTNWPGTIYAFDENANSIMWNGKLDPPLNIENFDPASLPIPAPVLVKSSEIVHIGRQLWVISKIDGIASWSADNLPIASRESANATSNTLPGFYVIDSGSEGGILTLEEDNGFWHCRKRSLGDGTVSWEKMIAGEPRGWWRDNDSIWIAYELFGETGSEQSNDQPGTVVCVDPESGEPKWTTPVTDGSKLMGAFRVKGPRVYLIERMEDGAFEVRAFDEDSGETFKSITYNAGDYITTLVSGDKIIFLHHDGSPESKQAKFHLYYSSLNPIKYQTILMSREDQLFPKPVIDGNLFLYAGSSYSVYDGRLVWQEYAQSRMVDWAADDYLIYIWDSAGSAAGIDRLTGQERWRTPFNALPPEERLGPNHGGASLSLADNRLFAATPDGEIARIDPATGELYPGVLRVTSRVVVDKLGGNQGGASGNVFGSLWVWVSLLIVLILGGFFVWFSMRKPMKWDNDDARPGF